MKRNEQSLQEIWDYVKRPTYVSLVYLKVTGRMAQNKGMEEYLPRKWNAKKKKKKAGVAILVSDKTDFKPTEIKKAKEGHYIMVKGSMQQEELS